MSKKRQARLSHALRAQKLAFPGGSALDPTPLRVASLFERNLSCFSSGLAFCFFLGPSKRMATWEHCTARAKHGRETPASFDPDLVHQIVITSNLFNDITGRDAFRHCHWPKMTIVERLAQDHCRVSHGVNAPIYCQAGSCVACHCCRGFNLWLNAAEHMLALLHSWQHASPIARGSNRQPLIRLSRGAMLLGRHLSSSSPCMSRQPL